MCPAVNVLSAEAGKPPARLHGVQRFFRPPCRLPPTPREQKRERVAVAAVAAAVCVCCSDVIGRTFVAGLRLHVVTGVSASASRP